MLRNLILCGTLSLSAACGRFDRSSGPAPSYKSYSLAQAGDSIPVRYGETVRVEGAFLTFSSLVSDTRCPAEAQCVAPGDAEIAVVADPGCSPCGLHSAALRLHAYGAARSGEYFGQRVTLVWLLPLPITPMSRPDPRQYVAWLKVERAS